MIQEPTEDILQTLRQLMQRFDVSTQIKPQDEFVIHNQTSLKIIHDAVTQLETSDGATTPYHEQLTLMAGALLSSAGEIASAETLFSKVREMAKDDTKRALACYNLFQLLVRCHSYARALEELQTAIKFDPSYALHDVHKYPIERLLGAGGMGCVFLCHDEWRENKVVVKCFWEGKKGSREEVFKEVLVMRQLQSPYVLKTISFGYADAIRQERPYFVTEYIEDALDGEMWLKQYGQLSLEMGLDVALQIAEGLAIAHQVGVCHLDLKPSNLLFKQADTGIQVKIIDFGLARVATSLRNRALVTQVRSGKSMLMQTVFGTLGYSPPEQQGETQYGKPGAKSDIFAFGATMYRLLTGENPRVLRERVLPDVPELRTLLFDCLETNPDKRPEINELVERLKRVLEALKPPVVESQPPLSPLLSKEGLGEVETVTGEQKVEFITIDSTPLLSHNGSVWQREYDPNQLVGDFLNLLYSLIARYIEPFTYGYAWILRDAQNGHVFHNLGNAKNLFKPDKRSLSEVGILAGCKLEITRLDSQPPLSPLLSKDGLGEVETVVGEQKVEFITIDSTPLLSHNGSVWQQKYDPNQSVGDFLDELYYFADYLMADYVEPRTYGNAWILRDTQSGQVFYELKGWRVKNNIWKSDVRTLSEVGILAGCKLEVIRPAFFEISQNGDLIEVTETTVEILRDTLQDGTESPEMVVIPAGTFRMGDVQGSGYPNEQPVHEVSVESFAMGRYPVTFEEYDKFAEATGREKPDDMGWGRGRRPVINISWYDALAYTEWLSQQTGEHYYLPTEAEWEYAAKAGTETNYWWGNEITKRDANYGEKERMTTIVGSYAPNPFGLYDTVGNVWEWTGSEYEEKYNGKELVCVDKDKEGLRVQRGGAWYYEAEDVRVAYRARPEPSYWSFGGGFRLARKINLTTPDPSLSKSGTEHTTSPLLTKEEPGAVTPKEEPVEVNVPEELPPALTAFRDRLHDASEGPEMVVIPAGQFEMGDIQGTGRANEQPVHEVFVESFAIGRYPITFIEYDQFAKATGREKPDDMGWGRRNRPVINVRGLDSLAYTQWLSEQTGHTYRLPTEAEWEYAARAGTETDYWWGNEVDKDYANYGSGQFQSHDDMTKIVGSFASNPFGLYDNIGNVWEWTCSEYAERYDGKEQQQCTPITSNTRLVRRGGCWCDDAREVRNAYRCEKFAGSGNAGVGFRVVRELSTPQTRAKQIQAQKLSEATKKIRIVQGDITEQQVDAIVNPTDPFFSGGGGADLAIHRKAGIKLEEACQRLNANEPGQAKITRGFNLPAKFIIHIVGPVWKGENKEESQILAKCYRHCLSAAKILRERLREHHDVEHHVKTIAFPAISTGAFGFPEDLAYAIAIREITQFLFKNPEFETVILVSYTMG